MGHRRSTLNRETLVNKLIESADRIELDHVNPSKAYQVMIKSAAAMLVMDKLMMEDLCDQIKILKVELTNQREQLLDQIKELREARDDLVSEVRELEDDQLG